MAPTTPEGFVLPPGEALDSARDGRMAIKARGAQTAGAFALLELVQPRETPGPPLHVHHECDETYYVLEGTLTVRLGQRTIDAPPGSFVLIPRGIAHTFANRAAQPVRFLGTISPASYFGYIEEINALRAATPAGGRIDMAQATAIGNRYATQFLGPPLDR
ncbi:MAG: cupin domain-containing protein [Thermomicrobiales bacterium]|nr:cupin domain-containing protein [Thermomicrobiales bacterium]